MSRSVWIYIALALVVAIAALFFVRPRNANGVTLPPASTAAGHRLAEAWCRECHSIEAATAGSGKAAPDFTGIANQPSTTALSLKVFLKTNHPSMPNLVISPDQADDLVNYILSLKRD